MRVSRVDCQLGKLQPTSRRLGRPSKTFTDVEKVLRERDCAFVFRKLTSSLDIRKYKILQNMKQTLILSLYHTVVTLQYLSPKPTSKLKTLRALHSPQRPSPSSGHPFWFSLELDASTKSHPTVHRLPNLSSPLPHRNATRLPPRPSPPPSPPSPPPPPGRPPRRRRQRRLPRPGHRRPPPPALRPAAPRRGHVRPAPRRAGDVF